MLWLSLFLPDLASDILCRATPTEGTLAVVEDQGRRPLIHACNPAAAARGIHAGMSLAAALTLVPSMKCVRRHPEAESQALERLAGWAGCFSPTVSLDPPRGLLLEIQGSLGLFGGLDALCQAVAGELERLGYRPVLAAAPFALAASLLAQGGRPLRVREPDHLATCLGALPTAVLDLDPSGQAALEALGIEDLAGLLALPRAGLARRFGPALPALLDRLLGRAPDPRPVHQPPPRFRARQALASPVHNTEAVLFACHRLLLELAGALQARSRAVEGLVVSLHHARPPATTLRVGLVRPGRDPRHWLALIRTRLERLALRAPVEAVELRAPRLVAPPAAGEDLFGPDPERDWPRLLERLQARLGTSALQGLAPAADHRPERAWQVVDPGTPGPGPGARRRPLWLLPEPVALDTPPPGSWQLQGPERIESGWWDGAGVARDYYVARTSDGERLWLFRERRGRRRWLLHGFFA